MTERTVLEMDSVQKILPEFVFMDCRLGSHPRVYSSVCWVRGNSLQCVATTGFSAGHEIGRTLSIGNSLTGYAFHGGKTTEREVPADFWGRYQKLFERYSLKSMLGVPIGAADQKYGVLNLYFKDQPIFDEKKHLGRAQVLAALIGYAATEARRGMRRSTPLSASIGAALMQARSELGLTQQQLAERFGGSRIALSRWEGGAQSPSIGQLLRWCRALGLISDDHPTIVTCVDVPPELLQLLREQPEKLSGLSPEQFERLIANRLDQMGFDVKVTGPSSLRDGGIDLIAVPKIRTVGAFLLAAQVKHHRFGRRTGREAVDRLLSWKDSPFRLGLLVTNTGFTRDALWAASEERAKHFLRLRDFEDLKRWLQDNFWSQDDWQEIPDQVSLAPGLIVEIPRSRIQNSLQIWPLRRL